jgi:hypothetical protein
MDDVSGVETLRHKLDEAIEAAECAEPVTEEQAESILARIERLARTLGLMAL